MGFERFKRGSRLVDRRPVLDYVLRDNNANIFFYSDGFPNKNLELFLLL
jgi:hypothetical protein